MFLVLRYLDTLTVVIIGVRRILIFHFRQEQVEQSSTSGKLETILVTYLTALLPLHFLFSTPEIWVAVVDGVYILSCLYLSINSCVGGGGCVCGKSKQ